MDYRSLVNKLEAIQRGELLEAAIANPYKDPAQAAKFNAMSDADQEWLTRGGGVPDITDQYILMRAPNGGKPDPAKAAAAQSATANAAGDAALKEKLAKLAELVGQLKGGQAAKPATMPAQATSVAQAKALGAANPQMAQPTTTDQPGSLKVYKESSITKDLVESFGYETTNEGIGSALMKAGGKALPGVGLALGAKDAYDRVKAGDYTGAAIAGAGGVANLIPGLGTAAQLGLMGVQAGRDKARTGSWLPDDAEIAAASNPAATQQAAKPSAGVDPKVKALQDKLIAAGAKIKADGIMGPATQAAMKQFPQVKESVAESMASLRDRLAMLETEQAVDENMFTTALKYGKGALAGLKGGAEASRVASGAAGLGKAGGAGMAAAQKAKGAVTAAGQAATNVAKNKVVQGAAKGAALAGAGAAAGYALAGKPAAAQGSKPTAGQGAKPTASAAPAVDSALVQQIEALMADINANMDENNPPQEAIAGLGAARAALDSVAK